MKTLNTIRMNGLKIFYIAFAAGIISALIYAGCSDTVSDLTTNPLPSGGAHPQGFADPSSSAFHGTFINDNKLWNLKECQECHGADYRGGSTGSSCLTCHDQEGGPENCALCHGGNGKSHPPKALNGQTSTTYIGVGMHTAHLDSTNYSATVQCFECHQEITSFDDSSHIGDNPDGIAEVVFGELANTSLGGVTPNPAWDRNTASCSGSYCHGTFVQGNENAMANWTQSSTVYCGTCHGDPATGNPNPQPNGVYISPHFSYWTVNDCYLCHNQVINTAGEIYDKEKHVNGVVNFNKSH